jgi:hypothetical protein
MKVAHSISARRTGDGGLHGRAARETTIGSLWALSILLGAGLAASISARAQSVPPTQAHLWYPHECCNDGDCAPVESATWVVPASGGHPQLRVRTKLGSATVPDSLPRRPSEDGRMHACIIYDEFGGKSVLCLFVPPSM